MLVILANKYELSISEYSNRHYLNKETLSVLVNTEAEMYMYFSSLLLNNKIAK